jgi:hypothetical protein
MTRLKFMQAHDVRPIDLVRNGRGLITRQHLYRVRAGTDDPRRPLIKALTLAMRRVLHRHVRASELFDLGDDDPPTRYHGDKMAKTSKEFDAFTKTMDHLLSVPKTEILRREAEYREQAAKNPKKRGPKPKAK